jgi:hypothetical protein
LSREELVRERREEVATMIGFNAAAAELAAARVVAPSAAAPWAHRARAAAASSVVRSRFREVTR